MTFVTYRRGANTPYRGSRGAGEQALAFGRHPQVRPDLVKHPLGERLKTFARPCLGPVTANPENSTLEDYKYVGSYNLKDTQSPTIVIPGKPPQWTPLHEPRRLNCDSGDYFRDPNAARFAEFPTEPAIQAIFKTDPSFYTNDIDIFGCGSTLGNLFSYVRSSASLKAFRFNVEVIGNTVFFVRKENDPRELIKGIHGYGHTFPEAYTTWEDEVKGSESHQRLIQYKLGGLKCIVRFECDGYLINLASSNGSSASTSSTTKPDSSMDNLFKSMEATSLNTSIPNSKEPITIQSRGCAVPQDAIFDLKTRSGRFKKPINMEDVYPVLWLKQIPNFIIAYHDGNGLFESRDIQVKNVKNELHEWQEENKADIERLSILLRQIIEFARQSDTSLLEVYLPSPRDPLELRKQHGEGLHALPINLMSKWRQDDKFEPSENDECAGNGEDGDEGYDFPSDDEFLDFTACSADDCGYCGKCTY